MLPFLKNRNALELLVYQRKSVMNLLYDVCIKVLITSGFVLNKHDIHLH